MGRPRKDSRDSREDEKGRRGDRRGKDKQKAPKDEEEPQEDSPIVKQLKEIDDKYLELEKEYESEVQKLRLECDAKQQPLLEERRKLLTAADDDAAPSGTPALSSFWLTAMQNHPDLEDSIQGWDEPVLEYLADIEKSQVGESESSKGFKLTLRFAENPFFSNRVLTKEYVAELRNPYCGEIEVKEIKCSAIQWKQGKNVTVERVVKKPKGGGAKKAKQRKEKEEPRPSFFRDFFRNLSPEMTLPEDAKEQARILVNEDDEEEEEDDETLLSYLMDADHEIGIALRDNIIPYAVRWYTGEAAPDMGKDDEDNEYDEEEEEEDAEEDEAEEEEYSPTKGKSLFGDVVDAAIQEAKKKAKVEQDKKKAEVKSSKSSSGNIFERPPELGKEECKQQ